MAKSWHFLDRIDVTLMAARLNAKQELAYALKCGNAWLQVVSGSVNLNSQLLKDGDGAAVRNEREVDLTTLTVCEVLLFDVSYA